MRLPGLELCGVHIAGDVNPLVVRANLARERCFPAAQKPAEPVRADERRRFSSRELATEPARPLDGDSEESTSPRFGEWYPRRDPHAVDGLSDGEWLTLTDDAHEVGLAPRRPQERPRAHTCQRVV